MLISLLLVQVVIFGAIFFLLKFLISRGEKEAIARLSALHEENLAREEELNEELKRAKEESQAQIQQGKDEAELIIEEAAKEAHRIRINMEEQAKVAADKIIANARIDAEKLKAAMIKDVQAQSVELAMRMITELLTETDKVALQYEFVKGIIEEISRLPQDHFNVEGNQAVRVTSSSMLSDKQRDEIKRLLKQKTGKEVGLNEQIDQKVIGGLTVELGGMVIDGTLKSKLQRIISRLK